LLQELSSSDLPPDQPGLAAIGEAALRTSNSTLAYAVAGAGLAGNPASHASFLFLRARSLPPWETRRHDGCLSAASELARRQRDHGLLDRIGQWREKMLDDMVQLDDEVAMSTEQINRVIQQENEQRAYPASPPKYLDDGDEDDDYCDCPDCRKRRAGMPPGMPPGLEVLEDMLEEMAEQFGQDEVEAAIDDLFSGLKRKGKKKRRQVREVSDHDIPF
jgi:hypothetical protein